MRVGHHLTMGLTGRMMHLHRRIKGGRTITHRRLRRHRIETETMIGIAIGP